MRREQNFCRTLIFPERQRSIPANVCTENVRLKALAVFLETTAFLAVTALNSHFTHVFMIRFACEKGKSTSLEFENESGPYCVVQRRLHLLQHLESALFWGEKRWDCVQGSLRLPLAEPWCSLDCYSSWSSCSCCNGVPRRNTHSTCAPEDDKRGQR